MSPKLAVLGRGKVHEGKGFRSLQLRVGPQHKASTFIMEGTPASCGLRFKDKDPNLQQLLLDAAYGTQKSKVGQTLSLYATLAHPEWVQQFKFYANEGTIGPAPRSDNPLCAGLCIGIDPDEDSPRFIMVERTDARRRCVFGGTLMEHAKKHVQAVAAAFPARLPDSDSIVLIVKHPPMPWLGRGQKAITLEGDLHVLEGGKKGGGPYWGRMAIGSALDAVEFVMDGEPEKMRLRLQQNTQVSIDYAGGAHMTKPGQDVNFFGNPEHSEWLPYSMFEDDGTLGPIANTVNKEAEECCLGYERQESGATFVKMVRRDDPRRLIFGSADDMKGYIDELVQRRKAVAEAVQKLKRDAIAMCTSERRAQLKHDGFTKFDGAVPPHVVREALREVNREIGLSSTTTDQFKAKTFATHPAVTNLVKQSMAPYICAELLGGTPESYRQQITTGQLALRFPGDMCDANTADCSAGKFREVAQAWHIDGCANDFIPGTTDHYGEIHNFSVLLGFLLSDVPEKMAGELCCFPGSHTALAAHFRQDDQANLKRVQKEGGQALPRESTWKLFPRPIFHGCGKAGDLFVANYMTAHFVTPNTSPHIRYAVYFRVQAPKFRAARINFKTGGAGRTASMVDPWCDWEGLDGVAEAVNGGAAAVAPPAPVPLTREELLEAERLRRHLATTDYIEQYRGAAAGEKQRKG